MLSSMSSKISPCSAQSTTLLLPQCSFYRLERSLCGNQTQRVKEFANQPRTTNRQRILKIASLSPKTSSRPSEKTWKNLPHASTPAQGSIVLSRHLLCSSSWAVLPKDGVFLACSLSAAATASSGYSSSPPNLKAGAHRIAPTSR